MDLADLLIWDNHVCMPLRPLDMSFLGQLERYRRAGATVVSLNVGFGGSDVAAHVRMIAQFRDWIARHDGDYVLGTSTDAIMAARAAGKLAIIFDIEGMEAVADQPSLVRLYHDLGVRWMLVAYNRANAAGGGCQDEVDTGLSDFGRAIIDEMEDVGMLVCCSHTGYRTARDVLEYARRPVIFSHSNPRALHDHPRNIPDDLIIRCAETGGLIGVNGIGIFLGGEGPIVDRMVRHIDYLVERVGWRHVSLGTDHVFDQEELNDFARANPQLFPPHLGYRIPLDLFDPEDFPALVRALADRNYDEAAIRGIMGRNLLELMARIEDRA